MATDPSNKVKFWAVLCGLILTVSVLIMLIDMSIKAAILEESANLRRLILGEREGQKPGDNTDNPEHSVNDSVPGNLLVPANPGMGKTGSNNGHKAPTTTRRATRQVPTGDPEIPSGD